MRIATTVPRIVVVERGQLLAHRSLSFLSISSWLDLAYALVLVLVGHYFVWHVRVLLNSD